MAVRNDGSLSELVCGDLILPCAACNPQAPEGAVAECSPEGHCRVEYVVYDETP